MRGAGCYGTSDPCFANNHVVSGENAMTSYGSGVSLSIPGEPAGMLYTAMPVTFGRCFNNRSTSSAGTWPWTIYPSTTDVWQEFSVDGTPSSFCLAMRSTADRLCATTV